ncbi:3-oxoacyl-ACP synthase [Micromonospora sp. RP3T]|uniref:3-oxoacyl-ACP synthase n=1 Tax=Micromonospora sp. RP3T TaxID=2135446 RepID=UPI0011B1DCA2|nr:3-oxoacyl-ACP synthase [Micromonospora sp. RP3T]
MSIRVLPVGTALPGPPVATATLARHLGLAAEPARRLGDTLGIRSRHLCRDLDGGPPHATLADLATTAAGQAMAEAGVTCGEIGGVVMSTATPDSLMPATVNLVADRLGIDHVPSYQIQAGATGALQAIGVAAQMVSTGRRHTVLVLAGDVSTKQLEIPAASGAASERSALDAASFGDAAAAVVVTTLDRPGAYLLQRLVMRRGTAGLPPGYTADWHGVAERGSPGPVVAYDRDIIAEAVPKLAGDLLGDLLDGVGWRCADLARLLPPQLPGGLAGITARHLAVAADRCDSVVEEIGHAANSLPLFQLAHAYRRSGPGDPVAGVAVDPSDWSAAGVALQRI